MTLKPEVYEVLREPKTRSALESFAKRGLQSAVSLTKEVDVDVPEAERILSKLRDLELVTLVPTGASIPVYRVSDLGSRLVAQIVWNKEGLLSGIGFFRHPETTFR